jgi:UDP:flavonoid glycosyltransferase YjiC (YdhE family)
MRAILLTGLPSQPGTNLIHVEEYAPYSAIMPLVSAVVHQGGIGTVAQTLRAGKPMLVVPWAHDQPDNGYRLKRMGVGDVLPRHQYTAARAANALKKLLTGPHLSQAVKIAAAINQEDGLTAACDRVEAFLSRNSP